MKRLFVLLAMAIFLTAGVETCYAKTLLEIAESAQQPVRDHVITMVADNEEYTIFDVLDEYLDLPTEVWLDPEAAAKVLGLSDTGLRVISVEYGYTKWSWKATIRNFLNRPIEVFIEIRLVDDEDYQVDYTNHIAEIKSLATETFQDESATKTHIFKRAKRLKVTCSALP